MEMKPVSDDYGLAQRLLLAYAGRPFEDDAQGEAGEREGDRARFEAFLAMLTPEDDGLTARWLRQEGPSLTWYDGLLPFAERVLGLPGLPQEWEYMHPDAPEAEKMGDPAYRAWREAREAAISEASERWARP